jgi:hypothetical protein
MGSLLFVVHRLCRQLNENHNMQFSWILFVKQIFNECGFSNIWETELFDNVDYLKCVIKQRFCNFILYLLSDLLFFIVCSFCHVLNVYII